MVSKFKFIRTAKIFIILSFSKFPLRGHTFYLQHLRWFSKINTVIDRRFSLSDHDVSTLDSYRSYINTHRLACAQNSNELK